MAYRADKGYSLTSGQVSSQTGAALRTVNKWAAAHGVAYTGEGRRKTYLWSENDITHFTERPEKGRPKKAKEPS
jgi:hypothetical protein